MNSEQLLAVVQTLEEWADMAELANKQAPLTATRTRGVNDGRAQAFRETATHLRAAILFNGL